MFAAGLDFDEAADRQDAAALPMPDTVTVTAAEEET